MTWNKYNYRVITDKPLLQYRETTTIYTGHQQQFATHLWEFVAHFFYLLPFLADDGSVKTLFNDQVLCTLILLQETVYLVRAHQDIQHLA